MQQEQSKASCNRGGRRRRHVPQAFAPDTVRELRRLRAQGISYKVFSRQYGRHRNAIERAVHGRDCYGGIA